MEIEKQKIDKQIKEFEKMLEKAIRNGYGAAAQKRIYQQIEFLYHKKQ